MTRLVGERLTDGARRRAIRQLQTLVGAGVPDDEAREQVMKTFDVSGRTSRYWLQKAYEEMAAAAEVDRRQLIGLALKRRRIAAARALRDGDTRAYLAACDSESRLLGLDMPARVQHDVLFEKVGDMSRAVVDVVKDFFADRPDERTRFINALRTRLNAQVARPLTKPTLVIDAEVEEAAQVGGGSDEPATAPHSSPDAPIADVAPTTPRAPDEPPPT
jgi:hypothetical protein